MFGLIIDPHLCNVFGYLDVMRLNGLGDLVYLNCVGFS